MEISFESFYQKQLVPHLRELETQRKSLAMLLWFAIFIGVVGFAVSVCYLGNFHEFSLDNHTKDDFLISLGVLVAWSVIAALFYKYVYQLKLQTLRSKFKKTVISDIVGFIDSGLGYHEHKLISKEEFEGSKLFPLPVHEYYGEDYLLGKEGEVSYKISEIHAQYTMKDHRGRKAFHTIFKGLFYVADVHQPFGCETVILPDAGPKLFSKFKEAIRTWQVFSNEVVTFDNQDFTKKFVVYSDSPEQTKKILNDNLIQRITSFKEKTGHKIFVSFVGNKVCVAISLNVDLFEPPVFGTMLNYDLIYQNYKYLRLVTGIVNDLEL